MRDRAPRFTYRLVALPLRTLQKTHQQTTSARPASNGRMVKIASDERHLAQPVRRMDDQRSSRRCAPFFENNPPARPTKDRDGRARCIGIIARVIVKWQLGS